MIGFLTAIRSGIGAKIAAALAITATVAVILWRVFTAGKQSTKLDNLKQSLDQKALEAKVRADIASTTDSARRKQLRSRWERRV